MATINRKKSAAKPKPATGENPPARKVLSLLRVRLRVVLALLVVVGLGWVLQLVWQRVEPTIIHRQPYLLTAERITTTGQPEWIVGDVRTEIIRNAALDRRLSILDNGFMNVVKDAFSLHPWIASVDKITK